MHGFGFLFISGFTILLFIFQDLYLTEYWIFVVIFCELSGKVNAATSGGELQKMEKYMRQLWSWSGRVHFQMTPPQSEPAKWKWSHTEGCCCTVWLEYQRYQRPLPRLGMLAALEL